MAKYLIRSIHLGPTGTIWLVILLEDVLDGAATQGARAVGQVYAREFEGFANDSRNVRGGELFVAVRTDRADGHDFIADAVRRGASGVLCERPPEEWGEAAHPAHLADPTVRATVVVVRDTRAALRGWARHLLRRQAPLVVGVTGSVGKTCTTKAIAGVLRELGDDPRAVFENDNFNDLFGLPISLSRLDPAHQMAVLELATDSAGEVAQLCELVAPQVGVVTNVAPAHLEHFGSPERLAREYGALAEAAGGALVLNADDPLVAGMAARARVPVTWFGTSGRADVRATDITTDGEATRFELHCADVQVPVTLALPGRHSVYTALAAAATALALGHAPERLPSALAALEPVPGRLNPLRLSTGGLLLDDTFSASLPSALAALDTLAHAAREPAEPASGARRIAVLGAVSGGYGAEDVGAAAAKAADYLVGLGDEAEPLLRAAVRSGLPEARVAMAHTADEAVSHVNTLLAPQGTGGARVAPVAPVVLVKGNEASRLERVVERLVAAPGRSRLVRQAPGAKQVVPLQLDRAAWMEVDLGAIAGNLARLRQIAAPAEVLAVLKADAYGHGAVRVARTAVQHGAAMLGVAVLGEAAALRERGVAAPTLVLGYTPAWQARDVVRLGVAVALYSLDVAQALSRAAAALERGPARVHVKVDTGMHRLGLAVEDVVPFARRVAELPGIEIEGVFTHFAAADDADPRYTLLQLARFRDLLARWEDAGLSRPRYVHAANSAAALRFPQARFSLVRTGIALYGMHPSADAPLPAGFRPALALKTQLAQVKEIEAGEPVSYGCTWVAQRPSTIGVLPIGYADGFRRAPQNWGEVLVRGRRAPLVGRVCMDMSMVDLTDVPGARLGDEVVLIGEQGGDRLTAEDVAARLGTINYEVVSQILARVPREIVSR
jgi:Alr-MurF fusion protein